MDIIGKLKFNDEELQIRTTEYSDGRLAVVLRDSTGLPYATISENIPELELQPEEFFAKMRAENEDLREPLLATGIFEDTGRRVTNGFADSEVWRLAA